jgi:hypothetical protein
MPRDKLYLLPQVILFASLSPSRLVVAVVRVPPSLVKLLVSWLRRAWEPRRGKRMMQPSRTVVVRAEAVDTSISPRVSALRPSKTMAITDQATALRLAGVPVIASPPGSRTLTHRP